MKRSKFKQAVTRHQGKGKSFPDTENSKVSWQEAWQGPMAGDSQLEHEKEVQRLEPQKLKTLSRNSVCCFFVKCASLGLWSLGDGLSAVPSVVPRPAAASPANEL